MLLRALLIWAMIALAEMLHGILRVKFLNRRVGDHRARQIGVFTGSIIVLLIAFFAAPWLGARTVPELAGVGLLWLLLMMLFEIAVGKILFRATWNRIAADFDPRRGGFLALGMLVLAFAPFLAAKLRGLV